MSIALKNNISLWEHQQRALKFMEDRNFGGLFMDMATGKTLTALAFMAQRGVSRALVIAPKKAATEVWPAEIEKYTVGTTCIDLSNGTLLERRRAIRENADTDNCVFIVNYDVVDRLSDLLRRCRFDIVVADEAHRLKAHNSKNSRSAAIIPAKYKLALTGTPLHDKPLDIFGIARFLSSRIFGGMSWTKFKFRYATWTGRYNHIRTGYINQDELANVISSFSFMVKREEVLDLPKQQFVDRRVELGNYWMGIYQQLAKEAIALVEDSPISVDHSLTKLLRLHQFAGGNVMLDSGKTAVIEAKSESLKEVLEDLGEFEDVVIFYVFDPERELISRACNGRKVFWINGHRNEYAQWKMSAPGSVVAVQMAAGSEGLDLSRAHYAVYYSVSWSLGTYQQSLARLHRPGQEYPVLYINLIAANTVDEYVFKLLQSKELSAERIVNELRRVSRTLV